MANLTIQPYSGKIFRDQYLYSSSSSYQHFQTVKEYSLYTGLQAKGTAQDMYQSRIFAEFDLSSIPTGIYITNAKLCLYYFDRQVDAGCPDAKKSPAVYCITEPWTESDFAIGQPDFESEYISHIVSPTTYGWLEFDITSSVRDMYSGIKNNYGWVIKNIDDSYSFNWNCRLNFRQSTYEDDETLRPKLVINYELVPPNPPTPIEPVGLYKDPVSVCRFSWIYNGQGGSIQKGFDLQWSTNQIDWTTVSQTTSDNFFDMPANTFLSGNAYWRVRTYNEYDLVSDYSQISVFYVVGAPATPMLNTLPANTARPVVTWLAFSQQVYQLQVLSGDTAVHDSGITPGINARQHKVKAWLADGEYTVRLRIKNEYDLWSEWGISAVTISTVKPAKPSLTLQRSAYGVEISATGIVYRSDYDKDDYICIGTASGTYFDNTVRSKGEYKYFVRAISENDTYNDSDIKFIQAELRHALIAPVSDLTNVFAFTRSLNAPPKRTYNRQPGGAFVEYAGRKSPVWEPTEHVSAGWSMTFFLKTWAEVETFTEIYDLNSTVLYRDAKGRKMYGTLSNLSVNDDILGYIISFTLSQVDYTESVEV